MERTTKGAKPRLAKLTPYTPPKRRNAARSVAASPAFAGDPPPSDAKYIELPTRVPGALPSGKIPVEMLEGDLVIACDRWPGDSEFAGTRPGDIYILYINGKESGFEWEVPSPMPAPGEDMHVDIPTEYFDDFEDGQDTILILQIALLGMPGENYIIYQPVTIVIDKRTPGGDHIPPIEFAEDIVNNGLTLAKLLQMPGQVLPATIAVYNDQSVGDMLYVFMRLRATGEVWPLGPYRVNSATAETVLAFTRSDLENVDGAGIVDFFYYIVDEVGRRSVDSPDSPVNMLINGAPEDIPAVIVPGFFDGIVTDPDARPSLEIWIPACTPRAQAGDYFIVYVDGASVRTDPLTDDDVDNNPLLTVLFPYQRLGLIDGSGPVATKIIWYELVRAGLASPSLKKPVDFDLSLPGGPDPDPDPDPDPGVDPPNPNDALVAPTLIGDSGSQDVLPPDDTPLAAIGQVPWFNVFAADAFEEGDRVQLFIDTDELLVAEYVVTDTDVTDKNDLELGIAAGVLQDYVGEHDFYYGITRTITDGQEVTAFSPVKKIVIQAAGELPGGGAAMFEAVFAGWCIPNPRRNYALGATSFVGGFTPVRIRLEQTNVGAPNRIDWELIAYKYDRSDVNNPVLERYPAGDQSGTYEIKAGDMDTPKIDNSLPHPPPSVNPPSVPRLYTDILLAESSIKDILDGAAEFVYTITNSVGRSEPSEIQRVLIDLR